ncbi:MAG: putative histidine kinase, atypical hybrid, partial [Ramlibacter sp.]|nr:putative histidine kinase, atypical hybrid [Ramlibacter sp.]
LSKNPDGNLSTKQVEFAKTIHSSGNDLLMLINDILDLSKIESGTVVVDVNELRLSDLQLYVERTFRHVAEAKNVDFTVRTGINLPGSMVTDAKRLQQILKNLLSNAFKFTHQGHVTLTVEEVFAGWNTENDDLNRAQQVLAFSVSDTGIGISPDKQQIIFEAFQQADGSTSRKYGGTGLGLAISRELSKLLGGEIRLISAPGQGSTFTLYLPLVYMATRMARRITSDLRPDPTITTMPKRLAQPRTQPPLEPVDSASDDAEDSLAADNVANDDRDTIQQGDLVLLIVENDLSFARFLLDAARSKGFKGLVTTVGAGALTLANQHKPSAVTLDMHLPDMAGWRVLDRMKHDLSLRHVPVCVISTDDSKDRAFKSGALAFVEKPIRSKEVLDAMLEKLHGYVSRAEKSLLVAVDDQAVRNDLLAQIEGEQVDVTVVASGPQLLQALDQGRFDAVVLEDGFADADPREFRRAIAAQASIGPLPLILYQGKKAGQQPWHDDESVTVHEVNDAPKLFDAALIALHRSLARLPELKRNVIDNVYEAAKPLAGKRVLIVDDDMRNIFALATVLEEHGMDIVWADNGREAINRVANDAGIQVVLMDIMMPEMDGMATMKEIRKLPQGRNLPMIAVTAKAMKGDREKCIEAGAWDYLAKPVNTPDLLAVLRAWLQQ